MAENSKREYGEKLPDPVDHRGDVDKDPIPERRPAPRVESDAQTRHNQRVGWAVLTFLGLLATGLLGPLVINLWKGALGM